MGRPRIDDEGTFLLKVRVRRRLLERIADAAERRNQNRSRYVRDALEERLRNEADGDRGATRRIPTPADDGCQAAGHAIRQVVEELDAYRLTETHMDEVLGEWIEALQRAGQALGLSSVNDEESTKP